MDVAQSSRVIRDGHLIGPYSVPGSKVAKRVENPRNVWLPKRRANIHVSRYERRTMNSGRHAADEGEFNAALIETFENLQKIFQGDYPAPFPKPSPVPERQHVRADVAPV
jgi:hypothetical protein